jgi:hypothetical protein
MEERTWETDKSWAHTSELFSQYIAEQEEGRQLALESREPFACFAAVRSWLQPNFRDCAYRGTIQGLDPGSLEIKAADGSTQNWPSMEILVMDPWATGVVIAVVLVLAVPVDAEKPWLAPGDMVNTEAIRSAKDYLAWRIHQQEQKSDDYGNTEMIIVAGADMLRARWRPSVNEPTIVPRTEQLPKSAAKSIDRLGKAPLDFVEPMALYMPMVLDALLTQMKGFAPEATVWDEGELLFSVQGSPYPHATRLFVTRDEATRDKEVEATEHQVVIPEWHPVAGKEPHFLRRNSNPEKDPGGVIALSLAISMGANTPWPKVGDFAKGPVLQAAADALLELLKEWNRQGKLQRCVVKVDMGFDTLRYSFIGSKLEPGIAAASKRNVPTLKRPEGAMEGFFVKVTDVPKHHLFDSEEHFQGIRSMMTERMLQDPERFKARALETAKAAASHLLEMNFPGSEITAMEGLPISFNDRAAETAVVAARHPNKTEKDIICAVYCIPSPDGELHIDASGKRKEWLGTPEAKAGLAKLLEKMQQWQKEGRLTEGECMAQLMIGIDADLYEFVDGRFEEPSEERIAQWTWG